MTHASRYVSEIIEGKNIGPYVSIGDAMVSATWTRDAETSRMYYSFRASRSSHPHLPEGNISEIIGNHIRSKYRRILRESGDYGAAARNLRRQGIPLAITRLILFGRV